MTLDRLWTARLLRKDNDDELDSIVVSATGKFEAIAAANREYRARHNDFWHYAYVWVEERPHRP